MTNRTRDVSGERREPWTLRRCAGYVPTREDECWRREAVRAEECAAQPCLTAVVSGERSESAGRRG